jgi:hypothetical protein
MLKKSTIRPICGYYNGWKKINNYLWYLYAGIVMDVKKNQQLFMKLTCGYCNGY